MIDTLKLTLSDFEISSNPHLKLVNPPTDLDTGVSGGTYPLFSVNGSVIEGSKAFHNADDFNVTIKPISPHDPTLIGCFVQFSAPKVLTGDNYRLADGKATAKACRRIETHLREIGIKTNIKTANISRLDAAKTLSLAEPCQSYFPVLGMLKGKRMANRDYGGTTHLWGNRSQEICAYDKIVEMESKKNKTTGLPSNSLRMEWRLLKSAKFKDATGMKTVKDLIENYDQIENCYRGNMEKQLFSLSVPDFQRLSASQLEDEFRVFIERGDPCFWGVWLRAKAIQGIGVDFDTAVETAVGMVSHREQKARIRRYFHQCRMDALALPDDTKRQTMGQLYTELKTKTLSA